jgi:hypothetical protein
LQRGGLKPEITARKTEAVTKLRKDKKAGRLAVVRSIGAAKASEAEEENRPSPTASVLFEGVSAFPFFFDVAELSNPQRHPAKGRAG